MSFLKNVLKLREGSIFWALVKVIDKSINRWRTLRLQNSKSSKILTTNTCLVGICIYLWYCYAFSLASLFQFVMYTIFVKCFDLAIYESDITDVIFLKSYIYLYI